MQPGFQVKGQTAQGCTLRLYLYLCTLCAGRNINHTGGKVSFRHQILVRVVHNSSLLRLWCKLMDYDFSQSRNMHRFLCFNHWMIESDELNYLMFACPPNLQSCKDEANDMTNKKRTTELLFLTFSPCLRCLNCND